MKRFLAASATAGLCLSPAQAQPVPADRETEQILRAVLDHYANELREEPQVCVEPRTMTEPLRVLRTGWSLLKPNEHYSLSTRPSTERLPAELGKVLDDLPARTIRNRDYPLRSSWLRKPLRLRARYDCAIGLVMQSPAVRGDFAVVHVRYHCGDGCGGTQLIGVQREGEGWRAFAFSQQIIS